MAGLCRGAATEAPPLLITFLAQVWARYADEEHWFTALCNKQNKIEKNVAMKTKICLAGFRGEELTSLKEAFAGANSVWDSHFAMDATTALAIVENGPLGVIVANMRMEGMNGAALLQKVGDRHPTTLRFIVGDLQDRAMSIDCISGTHQFICRPLKARDLTSLIQRSIALDAWLVNDQLRALVPKLRRLPSLPSTYFETLKQLENPGASADSVGAVIARDPAATARLLQMVNSTAYALERKVTDPTDAVCLLGMDTVKSLLLCMQVFGESDETRQAGLSVEQLWSHSLAVGEMARRLTFAETRNNALASDAFTAGLLHDVGRIVLASNLSKTYSEVIAAAKASGRQLHEEEATRFGVTHAQVGAYLLGVWGLPAGLVEAAALHHCPGRSPATEFSLLTAVHVANVFAYEKKGDNSASSPQFDLEYLTGLDMADKLDSWRAIVTGKPEAQHKAETKEKTATSNALGSARARTRVQSQAAAPNWLGSLLIRAGAVAFVAIVGSLWLSLKPTNEALPVRAKTFQEPPAVNVEPTVNQSTAPAPSAEEKAAPPAADTIPSPQPTVTQDDPAKSNSLVQTASPQVAPKIGFDSIKLQGVFYNAKNPSVIINGETVKPGEQINGVKVVSIGPSSVILSYGGTRKVLQVE